MPIGFTMPTTSQGYFTRRLAAVYPNAQPVVYGDALGSVYNEAFYRGLSWGLSIAQAKRYQATGTLPLTFKNIRREWRMRRRAATALPPLQPHHASLILPYDQTGAELSNLDWQVISREFVLQTIETCWQAAEQLQTYSATLLGDVPEDRFTVLLENFADCGFMSLAQETKLYAEMISQHVPDGAIVLLKGHPNAVAPNVAHLADRLADTYQVQVIDPAVARYPLEVWRDLIMHTQIISWAYCAVSVPYLYQREVINPMTSAVINRYFGGNFRERFHYVQRLTRSQHDNLPTWDGTSVLLSGIV